MMMLFCFEDLPPCRLYCSHCSISFVSFKGSGFYNQHGSYATLMAVISVAAMYWRGNSELKKIATYGSNASFGKQCHRLGKCISSIFRNPPQMS